MKRKIYNLLFEADNIDTPESSMIMTSTKMKARKALDSVDDQIDALILRYEASSIREEEEERAIASLNERSLGFLVEQEEEMEEGPKKKLRSLLVAKKCLWISPLKTFLFQI